MDLGFSRRLDLFIANLGFSQKRYIEDNGVNTLTLSQIGPSIGKARIFLLVD